MGLTHLQQILRILCSKTVWNYAVFWKLKHKARMILTWEDAFCDNHEPLAPSKKMCLNHTSEYVEGCYFRDPLELAVAKMSYHVYSLGEGIVGHVALTGKHQWFFADKPLPCFLPSLKLVDSEWQTQFSAGIKTIAVVSVVPQGVLQLGSLKTVIEDVNLVSLIKNLFYSVQTFEPGKSLEPNLELQNKSSHIHTLETSLSFSAGCELHEALGSAFRKEQDSCEWNESKRIESRIVSEPLECMANCWFTMEHESDDLLEAVVGNVCPSFSSVKSGNLLSSSVTDLLKFENNTQIPCNGKQGSDSVSESIVQSSCLDEEDARQGRNLVKVPPKSCVIRSPKESLSMTLSTCSEQLDMHVQPTKINRKRARSGENYRPRPRDRQLIQDRVKELRELVPNSSKCSIDALLARTIKHMLFLENVTKHADKLKKCADSQLHDKGLGLQGLYSGAHGSSWALEVGSQTKLCPIVVENLNKDGQILIEMLCEESGHFLELAEAVRGLGLTILRAVIEARDEKLWACFIVEGQNNRCVHRMDILLSLMQLPKPRTTV